MLPEPSVEKNAHAEVERIVQSYFEGLHFADLDILTPLFADDCVLKAPGIRRTRDEWLELVKNRPVPAFQGEQLSAEILSIEVLGDQAMVKASVPLLGSNFIDFLGLLRENHAWLIVNKMYADMPLEPS